MPSGAFLTFAELLAKLGAAQAVVLDTHDGGKSARLPILEVDQMKAIPQMEIDPMGFGVGVLCFYCKVIEGTARIIGEAKPIRIRGDTVETIQPAYAFLKRSE